MHTSSDQNAGFDQARQEFENARQAVSEAYTSFVAARNHLKAAALAAGVEFRESASKQFEDGIEKVNEHKHELCDSTERYIRNNPFWATGLAFLGGMLISRVIRK